MAEFETALRTDGRVFGLLAVWPETLAEVLELLARGFCQNTRVVALLDQHRDSQDDPASQGSYNSQCGPLTSALLEAGALAVIDSPRRISTAIEIALRYTASRERLKHERESFIQRAWAALPWQEA
jgi:hypothetical protein